MRKTELTDSIAQKANLSRKQAEAALRAFTQTVTEALLSGDNVQISGFGIFEVRSVAERMARNPATGEPVQIKAGKKPTFRPSAAFKDSFGGEKNEPKGD